MIPTVGFCLLAGLAGYGICAFRWHRHRKSFCDRMEVVIHELHDWRLNRATEYARQREALKMAIQVIEAAQTRFGIGMIEASGMSQLGYCAAIQEIREAAGIKEARQVTA